ncbi:MAG: M23 family metallopeptidase [Acidobacteriota bacterium]|nr:M23 family metallopeptidase [Acidobacteriota bacterium]
MQIMKRFLFILKKTLSVFFLLTIFSIVMIVFYEYFIRPFLFPPIDYAEKVSDPTEKTPVPTPVPIPSSEPSPVPPPETNTNQSQNNNITSESPTVLMIPVVGIKREQLQDTFNAARSEGRIHDAIDIMASVGTPVVAVADGEIAKFFDSERGGITIYQYSLDRRFVYYYAHLQKRADNLKEKDFIRRGTIVGYVGDTGNAGAGNYHLHFSIALLDDPKKIFDGTEVNPYPLLKDGIEAR